ncbi:unnamed protein product [Taenia asiatica]|uniref:Uncharacterized protein n=1 Tax=Taenia asiatica TaxID=60517 RepID=A0A0R3VVA7_TAEAS|nr:unnamed protein product [Taenia asiatica]
MLLTRQKLASPCYIPTSTLENDDYGCGRLILFTAAKEHRPMAQTGHHGGQSGVEVHLSIEEIKILSQSAALS